MISTILWGSTIIAGCMAYMALGGESTSANKEYKEEIKKDHVDETYEYFYTLTLSEQKRYFEENLDLRDYKDDKSVGITESKYFNAKHAAEIARRTGKPFTNRFKTY